MARSKFTPICLLVYFLCFGVFVSSVWGKVLEYKWKVEYMFHAPDCIEKPVMGINGQFPGPPIEAEVGDTIFVYLTNKLHTEGVVIHWHGIRQRGTPWADGTASISQCAINPEETFIYEFVVDKEGTYFYHGHYGMQRSAGLYGMLIVKPKDVSTEPFKYDGEFSLLLSDWWHHGVHEQAVNLSSNPMRWIGEPQTLLINGKGRYRCPLTAGLTSHKDPDLPECKLTGDKRCKPVILDVVPGKTYRLRVASTTALAALNVAIQDHKMDLVEADGNYVQRVPVDDFDIYSGETYSVIFTANQKTFNNYWIRVGPRGRQPGSPAALAILRYVTNPSLQLPTSPPPETPDWNNYGRSKTFSKLVLGHAQIEKPGKTYHRRIFLLNTQNLIDGQTKWAINNVSLTLPATPYLGAIRYGIAGAFDEKRPSDTFLDTYDIEKPPPNLNCTSSSGIYKLELHKTVDVILQNANMIKPDVTEIHPWHLHGHDFWVLGYGEGKFSSEEHESSLNLVNPPLKNTVVIFPRGWTAIRFVADNPGVWAFHCHIEPHLHMGMGVIFEEGVDQLKRLIPAETLACGLTGQTLLKNHQYVNLGN